MRPWLAGSLILSLGTAWCGACSPFQQTDAPQSVAAPTDAGVDAIDGSPVVVVDGAAPVLGSSCRALLELDTTRSGSDGIYTIAPPPRAGQAGAPEPLSVYCDMTLDKGGWTLVGRSAQGAQSTMFGWTSKDGIVTETRYPYSLDVRSAGLVFNEVLVVGLGPNAQTAARAYKFRVGPTFLEGLTDAGVAVSPVVTLAGDCDPQNGGPTTLQNAGATAFADVFFLRDTADLSIHSGLTPAGFSVNLQDCTNGASLTGMQGAIFVR